MLTLLLGKNTKRFQAQIITFATLVCLLVLTIEITIFHGGISPWVLIPLIPGIRLIDRYFEIPLIAKPLHYYHAAILSTFILITPSSAVLAVVILMAVGLARDLYRSSSRMVLRILQFLPALLSIWILARLYALAGLGLFLGKQGSLFPVLYVATGYYLFHAILSTACLRLIEPVDFVGVWRQRHLVPTLLFLPLVATITLIHYFAVLYGNTVYLLVIPLSLFTVIAHKIHIHRIETGLRRLAEQSRVQMSIIETLALAIDAKHQPAFGHLKRVQAYALGIAERMGIDNREDLEVLRMASLLHDIGKLAVPEYILSKPGELTDSEHTRMKRYAEIGANLLEPIGFPYPVVPIIRHRHEHYNGTGYPFGLKMDEIPLGSRILAVADTFETLTAQRPYHQPITVHEAIASIERESGTCYDPEVVKAFSNVADRLVQEASLLDTCKQGNGNSGSQPTLDSPEERKEWLRNKGFSEITSTHREIYTLYEIYRTVGKSLNADATMGVICEKLKALLPFSSCVIYLREKSSDLIHPAMVTGDHVESLRRIEIGMAEGLTGYALAFSQPVVNADPTEDFQSIPALQRPRQLTNSLIFPLKAENITFGAIALYSDVRSKEVYSEDHIRLMETISAQAAVSLHNALSFESYEENSLTDPLTGLPNSRFMFKTFEQNVEKAERLKEKMVILVMDLNNFKSINDQYGHKVGNDVLVKVSRILQGEMRKYDTCIRYGGDEFVAFLYNADREMSEKIVTRIKRSIQSLAVKIGSSREVRLGISIGMSMYPEDGSELNQLFTVADSQMYSDKFESKSENAQQDRDLLKDAISLEDDIEFQRVN